MRRGIFGSLSEGGVWGDALLKGAVDQKLDKLLFYSYTVMKE